MSVTETRMSILGKRSWTEVSPPEEKRKLVEFRLASNSENKNNFYPSRKTDDQLCLVHGTKDICSIYDCYGINSAIQLNKVRSNRPCDKCSYIV